MKHALQKLGLLLGGVILLEVVLQVGSLVALLAYSRDPITRGSEEGATILCVGDSYTYGVGSSSAETTYPAVMKRALAERGLPEPTVVNGGWPGSNSRDLLGALDGQLARFSPDVVLILIGMNDGWSKPDLLQLGEPSARTPAAAGPGWHWRLRTARLVAWMLGDSPEERAPPPAGAPAPPAAGGDGRLADPYQRGLACARAGDHEGAERAFLEALEGAPDQRAAAHLGLLQSFAARGMRERARESLEWLEARHRQEPTQQTAEYLMIGLSDLGETTRAFELALASAEAYPESTQVWWCLGRGYERTWRPRLAERAYDRALRFSPRNDTAHGAALMRDCARVCYERDAGKSLKLVVSSYLLDRDLNSCVVAMLHAREAYTPEVVRQALDDLDLEPEREQAARQLLGVMSMMSDQPTRDDAMCRVLGAHIDQAIARCRAAGAEPVLMTYPIALPFVEAVQERAASEHGVALVETRALLDEALLARPREELFVPDGHCSDGGYELMGRAAAEAVLHLVGP